MTTSETEEFPTELSQEEVDQTLPKISRQVVVLVQKTVFLDGDVEYDIEVQEGGNVATAEDSEVLGLLQYAVLRTEAQLIVGMKMAKTRDEGGSL